MLHIHSIQVSFTLGHQWCSPSLPRPSLSVFILTVFYTHSILYRQSSCSGSACLLLLSTYPEVPLPGSSPDQWYRELSMHLSPLPIHVVTNHYIAKVVAKYLSINLLYIVSISTKASHTRPQCLHCSWYPMCTKRTECFQLGLAPESEVHILEGEACEAAPLKSSRG